MDLRARQIRAKWLVRIGRKYQTVTETLQFGALSLPFTRIADPNRVLDEVAEAEDRRERLSGERKSGDYLHLPYWAELWDSAHAIAHWLIRQPTMSRMRVLDLGCGMGLSGVVAAACGASVLFADLEPDALLFAQLNSAPYHPRTRARRLDWRQDRLDESFDLILGADILYERKQWDFLNPFWESHLAANGKILLGEPGRQTGEMFLPWIRAHGWALAEESIELTRPPKRIRLLTLQRDSVPI
jgi:predicted nicotinamide N-methyase